MLVFVILYLAGAFSWWTYSLLSLSKSDFELANDNMTLKAKWIENGILKHERVFFDANGVNVFLEKNPVTLDTAKLSKFILHTYQNKYLLTYKPFLTGVTVQVIPSSLLINKVSREYQIRRRAYISESVFFILLMIAGFIWIFASIDKIINVNKLQKNFMMAVTHELKTPVAALKLMMQTLRKRTLDEPVREKVVERANQSADRLANLIDELLLAIKIEHKELKTIFDWVGLKKLLSDLVAEIKEQPNFSGSIVLIAESELQVWGDYLSLKNCFKNIVENAIKYCDPPLELVITLDFHNRTVSFADNGPGISANERKKVFRQFYRIGDENVRTTKGTGLGLFLVKNLLKVHNAKIYILPNKPKGSIFRIKF